MDESARYEEYLKKADEDREGLCRRCGGCCGLFENDPCVKLIQDSDGRTRCSDYDNRFGVQKTVHGNVFNCVFVRRIVFGSWPGSWQCGYKNSLTSWRVNELRS